MPSDVREPETKIIFRGEADVAYCFDFSDDPAVAAGETLSSPVVAITGGSASLVTFSGVDVNSTDFTHVDENGNVAATVPAGNGVKVSITPGLSKGSCTATATALASGGSTIGMQVNIVVK